MAPRKKGRRPKGTKKKKKIGIEISFAKAKYETTAIVYKKKTGFDGKKLPVILLSKNIDEVEKKQNLPNDHKITKALLSKIIATR